LLSFLPLLKDSCSAGLNICRKQPQPTTLHIANSSHPESFGGHHPLSSADFVVLNVEVKYKSQEKSIDKTDCTAPALNRTVASVSAIPYDGQGNIAIA
jgi:hypothetical protein